MVKSALKLRYVAISYQELLTALVYRLWFEKRVFRKANFPWIPLLQCCFAIDYFLLRMGGKRFQRNSSAIGQWEYACLHSIFGTVRLLVASLVNETDDKLGAEVEQFKYQWRILCQQFRAESLCGALLSSGFSPTFSDCAKATPKQVRTVCKPTLQSSALPWSPSMSVWIAVYSKISGDKSYIWRKDIPPVCQKRGLNF